VVWAITQLRAIDERSVRRLKRRPRLAVVSRPRAYRKSFPRSTLISVVDRVLPAVATLVPLRLLSIERDKS
jgi:hypothetical protein